MLRHASRRLLGVVLALFALLPGAALLLRADAFAIYCAGLCFVCVAAIVVSAMNRKAVCK